MIAKHKLTKANAVLVAAQINDLAANSEYPVVNGLAVSTSYVSGPALGNMETGELRVRCGLYGDYVYFNEGEAVDICW